MQNSKTSAQLSGGNTNSGDFGIQNVGMPESASE